MPALAVVGVAAVLSVESLAAVVFSPFSVAAVVFSPLDEYTLWIMEAKTKTSFRSFLVSTPKYRVPKQRPRIQ